MKNISVGIRATTIILAALGASVSRDAMAAPTCVNNLGNYNPSSAGTNPVVTNCYFADYVSVGPNVGMLAQDQAASSSGTYAFEADSLNNTAIYASTAGSGYGVYASSSSGTGVVGTVTGNSLATNAGVYGDGGSNAGVYGTSSGRGVWGVSTGNLAGVKGDSGCASSNCGGVVGTTTGSGGNGVLGNSSGGVGVYGDDTSSGTGVYGISSTGTGVYGTVAGSSSSGVAGYNTLNNSGGNGVYGQAEGGYGVSGSDTSSGTGVIGASSSGYGVYAKSSTGTALYVSGNGQYTGTWTHISDERVKKNVATLKGSLDQLLRLRGVTYEWKEPAKHGNSTGTQRGFIAQEYEKVFPEWVKTDNEGFKSIDTTSGLDALEVESIRELKAENDSLRARVDALEAGRRPLISGLTAEGMLFGVGFVTMAGAFVVSRRKRSESAS
jgi:hypothetical protein